MSDGVDGGTLRFNSGKTPYKMVPLHLLADAAWVLHDVTNRKENPYPSWNWARGRSWADTYECCLRHLEKWYSGEDTDDGPGGTGRSHIAHALVNLLFLTHYEKSYPEGDDRPKKFFSPPSTNQTLSPPAPPHCVYIDGVSLEL